MKIPTEIWITIGSIIMLLAGWFLGDRGFFTRLTERWFGSLEKRVSKLEECERKINVQDRKIARLETDNAVTRQQMDTMVAYFYEKEPNGNTFINKLFELSKMQVNNEDDNETP